MTLDFILLEEREQQITGEVSLDSFQDSGVKFPWDFKGKAVEVGLNGPLCGYCSFKRMSQTRRVAFVGDAESQHTHWIA